MLIVGILLIVLAVMWGCYANPYWRKRVKGSSEIANGFIRALIGIPAWGVLICLMIEQWDSMFGCLGVMALLLVPSIIKICRGHREVLKACFWIVGASMGIYSRLILAWTLIGIPANNLLEDLALTSWQDQSNRIMRAIMHRVEMRERYESEHAAEIALAEEMDKWGQESHNRHMENERNYRIRIAIENGRNWYEDPVTHETVYFNPSTGKPD